MTKEDKLVEPYIKEILLNPANHTAWFKLGTAYLKLGKIEESIESLNQSLILYPGYCLAYSFLKEARQKQRISCGGQP